MPKRSSSLSVFESIAPIDALPSKGYNFDMSSDSETEKENDPIRRLCKNITEEQLINEGYTGTAGRPHPPENCILLFHVHVLPSFVSLISVLEERGFDMKRVIIIPKPYSAISICEEELSSRGVEFATKQVGVFSPGNYDNWIMPSIEEGCRIALSKRKNSGDRFILVDDGGMLTDVWWRMLEESVYLPSVSIQQTASGFAPKRRNSLIWKVDVGRSCAKKVFESLIIADGVIDKVESLGDELLGRPVIVVCIGALGRRLVERLLKLEVPTYAYDRHSSRHVEGARRLNHWSAGLGDAQTIFGCTGRNFMYHNPRDIRALRGQRLVSLSSRDIEFKSVMRYVRPGRRQSNFEKISIMNSGGPRCTIYNGGFPINFDRETEWENPDDIALTRALILLAIIQSLFATIKNPTGLIEQLALESQRRIVKRWIRAGHKFGKAQFGVSEEQFNDLSWWHQNSGDGIYRGNNKSV